MKLTKMFLKKYKGTTAVLGVICLSCSTAFGGTYADFLATLSPTHHYGLNETTEGSVADTGSIPINGTHGGSFLAEVGGELAVDGPEGTGFGAGNVAFRANDSASVSLGPGSQFANSIMTVSTWFKVGIGFPGGSNGGDRIWTNNQADGNVSFQLTLGAGANLVVGLNPSNNNFPAAGLPSGSSVGNFQLADAVVDIKNEEWHHVVASRNGNNIEDVIIVVDGVHYDTDTWSDSTDTWGTTGSDAQIATRTPGDGGGSQHALNGDTDEVSVWIGRQLTVQESISLYLSAGVPGTGVTGDYDGDQDVDGADFLEWQRSYPGNVTHTLQEVLDNYGVGASGSVGSISAVPEPGSMVLLMTAFAFASTCLRRKKN